MKQCQVSDCDKPARGKGYCAAHYSRLRRHGTIEPTRRYGGPANGPCPVEGCDRWQDFNGMCKLHATRMARHGDPLVCIPQRDRDLPRGAANPNWSGDGITYYGMHQRVQRSKGRASDHPCAECGKPARHWSYDHADPDECESETGAYSTDLSHYLPRCVSCHKKFDLSLKAGAAWD